jgi:alkylhydroperoxidase/carboxymuconolactone decarboxylase family protein YurZ
MTRQEIYSQITKSMGSVPEWLSRMPDATLEHAWGMQSWFMSDSKLSARDKALVAFGAATANHCGY